MPRTLRSPMSSRSPSCTALLMVGALSIVAACSMLNQPRYVGDAASDPNDLAGSTQTGNPVAVDMAIRCNPIPAAGPSGCPGDEACYVGGNPQMVGCAEPGTGNEGSDCDLSYDCADGLTCAVALGSSGTGTCRWDCRIGVLGDCFRGIDGSQRVCERTADPKGLYGLCCPVGGC